MEQDGQVSARIAPRDRDGPMPSGGHTGRLGVIAGMRGALAGIEGATHPGPPRAGGARSPIPAGDGLRGQIAASGRPGG